MPSSAFAEPIFAGKLTKKVLLALPAGTFLRSNCAFAKEVPMILEHIPTDAAQREALWQKVKSNRLQGTLFYAFASAKEHQTWVRFRGGRPSHL